ncbi:hypothetical protein [Paraburkholderia heleia]|uniref:hypothetical protein n=1 Tax=Paraburkholderia heleia TaxID=634127 RepID=UPI002AB7CD1F|nr:hypothetical protein [Paraburkholderia heleia]
MDANKKIDEQLAQINQEIELLNKRKELAALLEREQLSDADYRTMDSFEKGLVRSLNLEIERMGADKPTDPSVEEFARDWIRSNWPYRFRYMELAASRLPQSAVKDALKELFEINGRNIDQRGEVTELYLNYRRSKNRPAAVWWRQFYRSATFWYVQVKGAGKRASELRAERRQHEIQRYFSSIAVIFTFTTAVFMTAMLFVGVIQLYNAVAEGIGIPFHVGLCHPTKHHTFEYGATEPIPEQSCSLFDHEAVSDPHEAMKTSLLALEIILVAPLPYLLVLGLTRYIKALAYQEQANEFRRELLEFKAFEVALFIAIIAAAVVEHTLRSDLTYEFSISVVLILVVLAIYYYIIEKASKAANDE